MRMRPKSTTGFSLLEMMLSLAVLTTGAIVALTVMIGTAQQNESQKATAIGYKTGQDVMEALLSMSYADLLALKAYQDGPPARTLTFQVTAAGFPRLQNGTPVTGTYTLADISSQFGWSPNSGRVIEIDLRIEHQQVRVRLVMRRMQP